MKGTRYPFTLAGIRNAPSATGVYCLWDDEELIYVGQTSGGASIQAALTDHHFGKFSACTEKATHFSFEVCPGLQLRREADLLEVYQRTFGQLPRCHRERD